MGAALDWFKASGEFINNVTPLLNNKWLQRFLLLLLTGSAAGGFIYGNNKYNDFNNAAMALQMINESMFEQAKAEPLPKPKPAPIIDVHSIIVQCRKYTDDKIKQHEKGWH